MRRDAATVRRHLARLPALCRGAGLEPTGQRRAVYEVLLRAEDHPSPETVFERLKPARRDLSLATVYKALDALVGLGVVREVSRLGRTRRFDANVDPHQHLHCTRCGTVLDFHDDRLGRLAAPRRIPGFVAREVRVEILGLCAGCLRAAPGRPRSPVRS
jgi:Fe2+ or Zn2+ uptake regulation protein